MKNETKQTAVDFFYDEVWACFSSNLSWSECELLNKIKEQAKEMEYKQMIEFGAKCIQSHNKTLK
jgi:hypothetical protein